MRHLPLSGRPSVEQRPPTGAPRCARNVEPRGVQRESADVLRGSSARNVANLNVDVLPKLLVRRIAGLHVKRSVAQFVKPNVGPPAKRSAVQKNVVQHGELRSAGLHVGHLLHSHASFARSAADLAGLRLSRSVSELQPLRLSRHRPAKSAANANT